MKGPNDLGGFSSDEKKQIKELVKEVEDDVRAHGRYTFDVHGTGNGVFSGRVLGEVVRQAEEAGYKVYRDGDGTFAVTKP